MRRDQAMWRGGMLIAAGVLIFAWGAMRDWDRRYLEWGTVHASTGLGVFMLYGLFGKPKRTTAPISDEHPG